MRISLSVGWQPDEGRSGYQPVEILFQIIDVDWPRVPVTGEAIVIENGDQDYTVESVSFDADTGLVDLYLGRWKQVNGDTRESLIDRGFAADVEGKST